MRVENSIPGYTERGCEVCNLFLVTNRAIDLRADHLANLDRSDSNATASRADQNALLKDQQAFADMIGDVLVPALAALRLTENRSQWHTPLVSLQRPEKKVYRVI